MRFMGFFSIIMYHDQRKQQALNRKHLDLCLSENVAENYHSY